MQLYGEYYTTRRVMMQKKICQVPGLMLSAVTKTQGVYTGVIAKGNGVGLDAPEEINNSALRGVQPTDADGTASFVTIVPGHYVGRTNHLHSESLSHSPGMIVNFQCDPVETQI